MLYWLIGLKKPMWANIIILLIGIGNVSNYLGTSPDNSTSDKNIKVLSYNVRLFNKYNWLPEANIQDKITNLLKTENADILCIQEFYSKQKTHHLNYPYRNISLQHESTQGHMAIYSKHIQIRKETVSIKERKMNNTCIYSDMIIRGDTIRVYNVHLASYWFTNSDYSFIHNPNKEEFKKGILGIIKRMKRSYEKRAEEVDIIIQHMSNSPFPLIVCGDFNDTPLSYAYNTIKANLKDAFSISAKGIGASYVNIPALRIDYILHDPIFNSTNYQVYDQVFSDHYAISSEIIIP